MESAYAYDTARLSPAEDVDVARDVGIASSTYPGGANSPLATHLAAVHAAASSHAGELWWMYAVAALVVLAVVFLAFCRGSGHTMKDGKARPRSALPSFDVEGAVPRSSIAGGSGNVLHPSIALAAKTADVAALREWLSDERCAVDAALAADGSTALHAAAASGHANVVRLLLDGGADALVVDAESRTPLHLVASAGHGLCVKALLDAGADPEGKDGAGCSPVALAQSNKHMGTHRMLRMHLERRMAEGGSLRRAR